MDLTGLDLKTQTLLTYLALKGQESKTCAQAADTILALLSDVERLKALLKRHGISEEAAEPDGYIDRYGVHYPTKVPGFELRPFWYGPAAPAQRIAP